MGAWANLLGHDGIGTALSLMLAALLLTAIPDLKFAWRDRRRRRKKSRWLKMLAVDRARRRQQDQTNFGF